MIKWGTLSFLRTFPKKQGLWPPSKYAYFIFCFFLSFLRSEDIAAAEVIWKECPKPCQLQVSWSSFRSMFRKTSQHQSRRSSYLVCSFLSSLGTYNETSFYLPPWPRQRLSCRHPCLFRLLGTCWFIQTVKPSSADDWSLLSHLLSSWKNRHFQKSIRFFSFSSDHRILPPPPPQIKVYHLFWSKTGTSQKSGLSCWQDWCSSLERQLLKQGSSPGHLF